MYRGRGGIPAGRGSRGGRGNDESHQLHRWMYKRRGRGRSASTSGRGNFHSSSDEIIQIARQNQSEYSVHQPPPPKKNRTDPTKRMNTFTDDHLKSLLPSYSHYFKDPPQISEFEKKVAATEGFLTSSTDLALNASTFEIESCNDKNNAYYSVEVDTINQNEAFCKEWPNFNEELTSDPDEIINLWSATAHKVVLNALVARDADSDDSDLPDVSCVANVLIGFLRLKPVVPLANIISSLIGMVAALSVWFVFPTVLFYFTLTGHFVTVKGVVVRTGTSQPCVPLLTFRCKICETNFVVRQNGGKFVPPSRCEAEDCNNTSLFEYLENAPTKVVVNSRCIRIQDTLYNEGGIPKTVECKLFGELADKCCSGDTVTLSGIVRSSYENNHGGVSSHYRYIKVSAIKFHKDTDQTMGRNLFSFTDMDYFAVQEIHDTPDLFRLLVTSLCPRIYGHELVKAGLLLSLFGGTQRKGFISRRSDINMLMIGDPGIGKSQMLKVIAEVAPRAVYICGNGCTTAGLTVTLSRDGEDFSLEAGALVLADKGVCCIDEFDKMADQHHALLQAMEQQCVSVAKSGVFRTLPARVSVFAAANPVGGQYDTTKTFSENIKISPPLLSRFDLIFVLLDKSDEQFDRNQADHVLHFTKTCVSTHQSKLLPVEANAPLKDRLKPRKGEILDLLPHHVMRKYIAYAKQYVHPVLSPEAANILKAHYFKLRSQNRDISFTPITSRLLESLFRLTQARAKVELREVATADDAREVIDIFECSMMSPLSDEIQAISALSKSILLNNPSSSSESTKGASKPKKLLASLQLYAKKENRNVLDEREIKKVASSLGFENDADSLIETLNLVGSLLMKGNGKYKLM